MKYPQILFFILVLSGCKPGEVPPIVKDGVEEIIQKWVPDKREGICSVELKMLPDNNLLLKGETNFPEARDEILSYARASGLEYTDSIKLLPDTSVIKKPWGLITVSVANIKGTPSHSSEMVTQAIMGTPVKILKKHGSWLLVQTPDLYLGWVNDSGIEEESIAGIEAWRSSDRLIYLVKSGDILDLTDNKGVVSDIVAGSIVERIEKVSNGYIVELPDGRRGRLPSEEVMDFRSWCLEAEPDAAELISFAKTMQGSPYMWGGTSTLAPDCSGFVKSVYFMGGVILARDASLQFLHGLPVDISASFDLLEPGDLLFFGRDGENGNKRITHVGLYTGDTEVLHSSGRVRINSLDSTRSNFSTYLLETLQGARRLIGEARAGGHESVALSPWYNNI